MNDRPTPETDAECSGALNFVRSDFARKLERDRDEARDYNKAIINFDLLTERDQLIKERDEFAAIVLAYLWTHGQRLDLMTSRDSGAQPLSSATTQPQSGK